MSSLLYTLQSQPIPTFPQQDITQGLSSVARQGYLAGGPVAGTDTLTEGRRGA